jgi:hypothetical protein
MGRVALRHDLNVLLTIIGAPLLAQRVPSGQAILLQESFDRVRRPAGQ